MGMGGEQGLGLCRVPMQSSSGFPRQQGPVYTAVWTLQSSRHCDEPNIAPVALSHLVIWITRSLSKEDMSPNSLMTRLTSLPSSETLTVAPSHFTFT